MEVYTVLLSHIERKLGKGVTSSTQLDHEGKSLFGREWGGVFASDEPWQTAKGYRIVNLDKRRQQGSHWVAVAGRLLYDSFGRKHILGPSMNFEDTERDAEQLVEEDNCGQRCLAWLGTYKLLGPEAAWTI